MKEYLVSLKKAQDEFDAAVADVATRLRLEVIIPTCKQFKLKFTSGMGTFFFTTRAGNHIGDKHENMRPALRDTLSPIFDLLNEEVSHNQCLGYYVSDVDKEDIK